MFILKKGHQPGVYVPLRALFLVHTASKFPQFAKYTKKMKEKLTKDEKGKIGMNCKINR